MIPDLEPFYKAYRLLASAAEQAFEKIKTEHPDCVKCTVGCTDCCYAVFDVSFVEAMHINQTFLKAFDEKAKQDILEKANRIDRKLHKIKREIYKKFEDGTDEDAIFMEVSKTKIRCPLLNDDDKCDLYDARPITCRLYGIPTAIGGVGRTCGLSGFEPGTPYTTVHIDKIQQKLYEISNEMVAALGSQHIRMGEILMPVSMAILTEFNEAYLGIPGEAEADKEKDHEQK